MSKEILQDKHKTQRSNLKQYEVEYTAIGSFQSARRELGKPEKRGFHHISGSERIQSALFVV
jgi:hypothetical protein